MSDASNGNAERHFFRGTPKSNMRGKNTSLEEGALFAIAKVGL